MFANLYWYLFEKYKPSMEKTTGEQTDAPNLAGASGMDPRN